MVSSAAVSIEMALEKVIEIDSRLLLSEDEHCAAFLACHSSYCTA